MRNVIESGHNGQKLGNQRGVAVIAAIATRYSEEELKEFRQIILTKLRKAKEGLAFLKKMYSPNPHGTDDGHIHVVDEMDRGQLESSRAKGYILIERQKTFISNLELALVRIENKTYGICRETGKLISKGRLMAVPHATLSIEAKRNQYGISVAKRRQKIFS